MEPNQTQPVSLRTAIHALSFREREVLMLLILRGISVEGALAQVQGRIVASWGAK